jgi:hypothetical protein
MKVVLHLKMIHHFVKLCKQSFKIHLRLIFDKLQYYEYTENIFVKRDFAGNVDPNDMSVLLQEFT